MNHDSLLRVAPVSFSFTSQLANLKNTLTLWEDVVSKTMKLSAALRTVIQCIAGFLEAFQKIADSAYGSNCGLRELGGCMTRFCLRERGLESRLRTFNSQLMDCLAQPLADRLEEWRRTVAQLERENNKEWRRARSELQRVTSEVDKLNKRFRRKASSASTHGDFGTTDNQNHLSQAQTGENVQLNFVQHDLAVKRRTLAELERANLRRAVVEERRRFAELITCLKPVLDSQTAIFSDVGPIDECIAAISKHVYDPNDLPSDTEQAVEEAADQVSASRERKLSDVRSVMRFGKAGTIGNFDSISLRRTPGHCSQLSLHSSVSASNSTWNSAASSIATAPRPGRGCPSPLNICPAVDNGEPRMYPQSPCSATSGVASGHGSNVVTDSFSLFEHVDNTQPCDVTSLGPSRLDSGVFDSSRSLGVNGTNSSSASNVDGEPPGYGSSSRLKSADQVQYCPSGPPRKSMGDREDDEEDEDVDGVGAGDGGATTEDTEDGETEDDEKVIAANGATNGGKPSSMLYPNQAIPAPVYTNLSELKRAAARKFRNPESASSTGNQPAPQGLSENATDTVGQISPYATASTGADLRRPINEVYAAMSLEPRSPKLPTAQGSVHVSEASVAATSVSASSSALPCAIVDANDGGVRGNGIGATSYPGHAPCSNEGFITTQVNSGTSTFRRRQSEYAKRHPPDAATITGLGHMSRIMNVASATPAIVRRGSQACTDISGRNSGRPTNPPRRSSSVSREFSHTHHSTMTTEALGVPGYFVPCTRSNGTEQQSGIQRVSSSVFAHPDSGMANQVTNGKDYWPTASVHGPRPNLIQLPPGGMIRPASTLSTTTIASTVSVGAGAPGMIPAFFSESPTPRSKGMPLTPPPLATVAAPSHSKTSQLMFGVKVLPSQIPALPLDPSSLSAAHHNQTVNRQVTRQQRYIADNSGGHYASASRLHRTPAEDGSTSFIE